MATEWPTGGSLGIVNWTGELHFPGLRNPHISASTQVSSRTRTWAWKKQTVREPENRATGPRRIRSLRKPAAARYSLLSIRHVCLLRPLWESTRQAASFLCVCKRQVVLSHSARASRRHYYAGFHKKTGERPHISRNVFSRGGHGLTDSRNLYLRFLR